MKPELLISFKPFETVAALPSAARKTVSENHSSKHEKGCAIAPQLFRIRRASEKERRCTFLVSLVRDVIDNVAESKLHVLAQ